MRYYEVRLIIIIMEYTDNLANLEIRVVDGVLDAESKLNVELLGGK